MSEDRKPQSADKYIVRFPDGMRDKIAETAKANNRSMNAEIISRMEGGNSKEAEIQRRRAEAKKAQIEQAQVGLSFIMMAVQFLEKECPEIRSSKSRSLLLQSIKATAAALPEAHPRNIAETLSHINSSQAKCLKLFGDFTALELPEHVSDDELADLADDAYAALDKMAKAMEKAIARRADKPKSSIGLDR